MQGEERVVIETMTVQEVCDTLRDMGVKTTPIKIRAGIAQGVYPFGIRIQMENQEFEIYRALFEKWVDERATIVAG